MQLASRIEARAVDVGVVGLGFVGLGVACALADAGFRVRGVERDAARAAAIAAGRVPWPGAPEPGLAELLGASLAAGRLTVDADAASLAGAEVFVVAVETPVDEAHAPRLDALVDACGSVGRNAPRGALVVVESTLPPGATARVVAPALARASGLDPLRDELLLGHCPERVMPGKLLANLRAAARACGGATPAATRAMLALYGTFVRGPLDATDAATAEIVKTAENAARDVAIAFANELARVCEARGVDFLEARRLVNRCEGRDVLLAGAGVGGACLPKDPWLLVDGVEARLVPAARAVNDEQPARVADLAARALSARGVAMRDATVVVLGRAYLEETGDVRGSPGDAVARRLVALGARVRSHDPWVPGDGGDPYAALAGAHAAIVATGHAAYRGLDLARVRAAMATPLVIDARHVVDRAAARAAGVELLGVGMGAR